MSFGEIYLLTFLLRELIPLSCHVQLKKEAWQHIRLVKRTGIGKGACPALSKGNVLTRQKKINNNNNSCYYIYKVAFVHQNFKHHKCLMTLIKLAWK